MPPVWDNPSYAQGLSAKSLSGYQDPVPRMARMGAGTQVWAFVTLKTPHGARLEKGHTPGESR